MVLNIYVARHGQDQDNSNGILNGHRDEPLTELGRQQAKDVANKMLQAGFTLESTPKCTTSIANDTNKVVLSAVYSSPLKRAFETANIFAETLSISTTNKTPQQKVQVLDDLIERDFGRMTGQPTSSIIEKCGIDNILVTETINYFLHPQGAETFPNLIDRAKRLLSHIEQIITSDGDDEDYDSETSILLVTHGDFGKMIYAAYYNLPWEDVLRSFHFGNSEVLLLSKSSSAENAHVFETKQYNS